MITRSPGLCAAALWYAVFSMLGVVRAISDEATELKSPDARYQIDGLLFSDDFTHGLDRWTVELEKGGTVRTDDGKLIIDVPAGCTCWFKPLIKGPALIYYDATVIKADGPNNRVSDLNCFWMAQDSRVRDGNPTDAHRGGSFAEYDALHTYYVGLGGNGNTTTRFRRYVGESGQRPLLPEHDLRDPKHLLTANARQTLRLVADGSLIQCYRDAERLFEMNDAAPYTSGWFAVRTVSSHLEIEHFRIYRLRPAASPPTGNSPVHTPQK